MALRLFQPCARSTTYSLAKTHPPLTYFTYTCKRKIIKQRAKHLALLMSLQKANYNPITYSCLVTLCLLFLCYFIFPNNKQEILHCFNDYQIIQWSFCYEFAVKSTSTSTFNLVSKVVRHHTNFKILKFAM